MADIKKINGYYIKDEFARNQIQLLDNKVDENTENLDNKIDETAENLETVIDTNNTNLTNLINQKDNDLNNRINQTNADLQTTSTNLTNLIIQKDNDLNNRINQTNADLQTTSTNLTNLINQTKQELNTSIIETNTNMNNNNHNRMTNVEKLRLKYSNDFRRIVFPENMDNHFKKLLIFESYNKERYEYYINENELKNHGGTTYYVDINYDGNTNDGSSERPWKSFRTAFTNTQNGDTIIVRKGVYTLSELPNTSTEKKNINIICEDGVIFVNSLRYNWTQNETFRNVYQVQRTRVSMVIDLRNKDKKLFPKLTKLNSLEQVAITPYSYFFEETTSMVYVNLAEPVTNDNVAVLLEGNYCPIYLYPYTQNLKIWLENAIFLSGTGVPFIRIDGAEDYSADVTCKDCQFLYGGQGGNYGCITVGGANTVFINCKAMYNVFGDGFTYHSENGRNARGIEINCEGAYNGFESYGTTMKYANNGSTIHEQSQIIRINGNYHNNNGCNVADTGGQAISLNYGCKAWDSEVGVEGHNRNADFGALASSAKMYLYSCFAQGKSEMNIYCGESNNRVYISNCLYNTTGGNRSDCRNLKREVIPLFYYTIELFKL